MNDLFKIQKRLINWKCEDEIYFATKQSGEQFRVLNSKKGFSLEKLGIAGWRRNGDFIDNIETIFEQINKM